VTRRRPSRISTTAEVIARMGEPANSKARAENGHLADATGGTPARIGLPILPAACFRLNGHELLGWPTNFDTPLP
jgi:hypothetical protein